MCAFIKYTNICHKTVATFCLLATYIIKLLDNLMQSFLYTAEAIHTAWYAT